VWRRSGGGRGSHRAWRRLSDATVVCVGETAGHHRAASFGRVGGGGHGGQRLREGGGRAAVAGAVGNNDMRAEVGRQRWARWAAAA
jgi:hypothetical protein